MMSCWRAASPCPRQVTSCQAWFRCERTGSYVIRWRCQSLEEEELSPNVTAHSLCGNQLDSTQLLDCPPPIVCSDDFFRNNLRERSHAPISKESIIIIALATFALLAVVLIVVSSCKYWQLKKRESMRQPPRHFMMRDFQLPISYHNFWGTDYQHARHHGNKEAHMSRPLASSHPDVYFSRSQKPTKNFDNLLTTSDNCEGRCRVGGRGLGGVYCQRERTKLDHAVITESFIYHQPTRLASLGDSSESWFHQNKHNHNESGEVSLDCYHVYRGRALDQHQVNKHSKNEYHHLIKPVADHIRTPRLTSIPIPAFGGSNHPHTSDRLHVDLRVDELEPQHRMVWSDSSHQSDVIPVTRSDPQHSRHGHSVSPNGTGPGPANRTSPDVISSHNFSKKFVRVGKNVYKPVLTHSPSGSSITISSGSNRHIDISYDSFINDHFKQLGRRGAASSSTLEAGPKTRELNSRY